MSEHRDALGQALERVEAALAHLDECRGVHHQNRDTLKAQHEAAWRAMAEELVPGLDERLDLTARVLALHDLELSAVRRRLEARRRELEAKKRDLESTDGFAAREVELAEVIHKREEIEEHLGAVERSVLLLERDPEFRALFDSGYGTEADSVGFWQLSFYRRRGQAEATAARHGAVDFIALRLRYLTERGAAATLRRERADLEQRATRLGAVARLYAETVRALATLEAGMLEELRARVEGSLRALDLRKILEMDWPDDLRGLAASVEGTLAKGRYLRSAYTHYIEDRRGRLLAVQQDLGLALEGDMSRWYVLGGGPAEIDHRAEELVSGIRRSRAAYEGIADRLIAFARYERWLPGALWWDLMCGGAYDGDFIDEVVWHRTTQRAPPPSAWQRTEAWETRDEVRQEQLEDRLAAAAAAVRSAPAPVDLDD